MTNNRDALHRALRQQLESLSGSGVLDLPKPTQPIAAPAPEQPAILPQDSPAEAHQLTLEPAAMPDADTSRAPNLDVLRKEVAGCSLCEELAAGRTQTVFGVGSPNARLCFLGEAPGADEDRLGEPFVGRAGQLLNKILEACKLARDEVYILNILKCRPPGNRNPLPEEADNCGRYLRRQLELIGPEFICCLGLWRRRTFGNPFPDREAPRQGPSQGPIQRRLHLPPRVPASQPGGQERHLGRHEAVDARDGDAGGLKLLAVSY